MDYLSVWTIGLIALFSGFPALRLIMGKTFFLNKGLSWTQHDTTAESLPAPDSCPAKVITRHCYIHCIPCLVSREQNNSL